MKKILIALVMLSGLFSASNVEAATKKVDRASLLSSKATIETIYNKSVKEAKYQFELDISTSKQLKGKAKSTAIKAAAAKRQQSLNKAKDVRKKQLKELSLKK